jgi:hypothetical protein
MGSNTANLQMLKPDPPDTVNVTTAIADNLDILDPFFPPAPDNNGFAEYGRNSNFTVVSGADTKVALDIAHATTTLLEPSGDFKEFTVKRGGIWGVGLGLGRWSADPNEAFAWIGPSAATTTRYVVDSLIPGVAAARSVYREVELALNDVISYWVWQNSGSDKDITDEWLRATYFTARWIRPS